MSLDFVIGAPSWKRSWSLPLWFESVRANVNPAKTGLAFVVPAQDVATREVIRSMATDFAWVDIQRDKNVPLDIDQLGTMYHHRAMASAKNWIISNAIRTKPRWFIYWDTDLLVPAGTVDAMIREKKPLMGVWAWLNRADPERILWENPETKEQEWVNYESPMQATAMRWEEPKKAIHFPAKEFEMRSHGTWRADVVLGFQMMEPLVYRQTIYREHVDGEDIPFHWDLHTKGIPRFIMGDKIGVHLHQHLTDECEAAWEDVMDLAKQWPIATVRDEPRAPEHELLGLYPER